MTLFDSHFRSKYRSLVSKARKERVRTVKLEENLWYCARRAAGHGRYLIYLDATKSGVFATCRTIKGAACPSYKCCIHIASVFTRLIAEMNRRDRKQGTRAA